MKTLIILISFFCSFSLIGQTNNEWQLFNSINGVNFLKKELPCTPSNIPNQKGVLIKIENTNNYNINASWDLSIWYNGKKQKDNIEDNENTYTFEIQKKSSIEGSCDTPNGGLYIFKEFTTFRNGSIMTKFVFNNIIISKHK